MRSGRRGTLGSFVSSVMGWLAASVRARLSENALDSRGKIDLLASMKIATGEVKDDDMLPYFSFP